MNKLVVWNEISEIISFKKSQDASQQVNLITSIDSIFDFIYKSKEIDND